MRKMHAGIALRGAVWTASLAALALPGILTVRAEEPGKSIKQLRKEVKAEPANADLHFKLAKALSDEGRLDLGRFGKRMSDPLFEEAIAEYTKTVELQPANNEARRSLVSELEFRGRYADARAQLRELVKLNPGEASAHLDLARANLHQEGGDLKEAMAEFRAALQIDPANSNAWGNLGEALARAGQFEDSAAAYGELLKLHPDDDIAHFSQGDAWRHAGKLDAAVEQYREAIRRNAQWKDMLATNLAVDLAAKDAVLARRDAQILEKLGYPADPQLLEQLSALETSAK